MMMMTMATLPKERLLMLPILVDVHVMIMMMMTMTMTMATVPKERLVMLPLLVVHVFETIIIKNYLYLDILKNEFFSFQKFVYWTIKYRCQG